MNRTLEQAIATRDNAFNAVRLALSLFVVFFHAYAIGQQGLDPLSKLLAPYTHIGQLAVGTFFLLSGVFVMQSWARDPRVWAFIVRRVARVTPGLTVCVTITALLAVSFFSLQGVAGVWAQETWHYITSNALLHFLKSDIPPDQLAIPGVFPDLPNRAMNGSLWSLYWEGKFYVLLALIGLLAVNRSPYWFTLVAGLLMLLLPVRPEIVRDYLWEYPLLTLFLVGVVLQTVARHVTIRWQAVAGAGAFFYLTRWGSVPLSFYLLSGIVALWLGSLSSLSHPGRAVAHLQKHDYSYSVYIYHWPVLQMLKSAFPEMNAIFLFLSGCLLLGPIALFSWFYVEAPCLRLGHTLCRRFPAPSAMRRQKAG